MAKLRRLNQPAAGGEGLSANKLASSYALSREPRWGQYSESGEEHETRGHK